MPIGGIESVVYGVDSIPASTMFFDDFGLKAIKKADDEAIYRLEEGSRVILRRIDDPSLPAPHYKGNGIRETYFAVDSREELDSYAARVGADREVRRSEDGNTIHFASDCGIPLALRVWTRRKVNYAPDAVNAPDNIKRLSQVRRWRVRALPKTINHVVWRVQDYEKSFAFFRDRLDFRLTDTNVNTGIFARAEGTPQHHLVYLMRFDALGAPAPGYDHIAFGVEDIDELFVGWNYMDRRGWKNPLGGPARHRISSAAFSYIVPPCGGLVEYHADTDYLDDSWVPRSWEPAFGGFMWSSQILPFIPGEPKWDVTYVQASLPQGEIPKKRT